MKPQRLLRFLKLKRSFVAAVEFTRLRSAAKQSQNRAARCIRQTAYTSLRGLRPRTQPRRLGSCYILHASAKFPRRA